MTTTGMPDPFEGDSPAMFDAAIMGFESNEVSPITEEEIQRFIDWLNSTPTAEVNN